MAIGSITKSTTMYQNATNMQTTESKANTAPAISNSGVETNVVKAATVTNVSRLENEADDKQNLQEQQAREQQIKSAISTANSKMKQTKTRCEFSYHEVTKRISIKVLDSETEEVIREIPAEDTLKMIEKMWELAGILVDERR